jgi:hypothetical protein
MRTIPFVLGLAILAGHANAAPPMTEFFLTKYDGKDCLARAASALTDVGFKATNGTFTGEDRVGVKGDYKGVCKLNCVPAQ